MDWESLDWEVLDRLRDHFISGTAAQGPYWHTITDLECYNFTYAERIGWKWDAVLRELPLRGWMAPANATILDWGCGSGVAGRRVVEHLGAANVARLLVHDHSPLAMDFAEYTSRRVWPALAVEKASRRFLVGTEAIDVLVISHVLNELDDVARADLRDLAARAQTILWVEPGTHEVSRLLGGWREALTGSGFLAIAPCPHQQACGVLTVGNERHWCHFFAPPPAGVYADSGWVKFGQRAGIDLRSLPYSYLVLDRRPASASSDAGAPLARIIGDPRHYKGYAKLFACAATGVAELTLQKRDAPELFKALKEPTNNTIYRWTHTAGRIQPGAIVMSPRAG
jgi:hypothetical protein